LYVGFLGHYFNEISMLPTLNHPKSKLHRERERGDPNAGCSNHPSKVKITERERERERERES